MELSAIIGLTAIVICTIFALLRVINTYEGRSSETQREILGLMRDLTVIKPPEQAAVKETVVEEPPFIPEVEQDEWMNSLLKNPMGGWIGNESTLGPSPTTPDENETP